MEIKVCYINAKYIQFLQEFENKIQGKFEDKSKYLGIAIQLKGIGYFLPIKELLEKSKNKDNANISYELIRNGKYGIIAIDQMVPIKEELIQEVLLDNITDEKYKVLVNNQIDYIFRNKKQIINKAEKIYNATIIQKNRFYADMCFDFGILEANYLAYQV